MLLAAKEETFSSFGPWCVPTRIGAHESEGQKTHQGVSSKKSALFLGRTGCKSRTVLGLRGAGLGNRVRSRCQGKERDAETLNDEFGARYYTWRFGRWLSSDWSAVPAPVPYANLTNPQTLNLYSMVADDPETFADLDGHCDANAPVSVGTGCGLLTGNVAVGPSGPTEVKTATADQNSSTPQNTYADPHPQATQILNTLDAVTKPVQPLAKALQKLPDVDVNVSGSLGLVTKSTDGSTSVSPVLAGASVDVKATLVKNPSKEIGDVEVGASKHTSVSASVVLNENGKPRVGSVGGSFGVAWPEAGRVSGSLSSSTFKKVVNWIVDGFQKSYSGAPPCCF